MKPEPSQSKAAASALAALTALGVVFGDIGTSPLYAFRECFAGPHASQVPINPHNLTGAASLVIWSLLLIVSAKYLLLIFRLDYKGEGGILALTALLRTHSARLGNSLPVLLLGLVGAALIYADGTLTPAISVLSAVEGFAVSFPMMEHWVVPITLVILLGIFALQSRGSHHVGKLFGPVVLVWFLVLGALGIRMILRSPEVLLALTPWEGMTFLIREWRHAMPLLAATFLAVTGGEALYADLGHFGRRPIRLGWFTIVLPGLILNYLGQAALLSHQPEAISSPFFLMAPEAFRLPLTLLATAAAIIASQALITGAFSLTAQAVQLGVLPRFRILHTSQEEIGQVYVPMVNYLLGFVCLMLVCAFQTSAALAGAYGIAIALTMAITSILFFLAARVVWKWSMRKSLLVAFPFMLIDCVFLFANFSKLLHGGWLPLFIATVIVGLMLVWMRGRRLLWASLQSQSLPIQSLLDDLKAHRIHRVKGTAVYMTGGQDIIPPAMLHNLKHNQVLHDQVLMLNVAYIDRPHVPPSEMVALEELDENFFRVVIRIGFADEPNVPSILKRWLPKRLHFHPTQCSYFLGRESYISSRRANWFDRLRLSLFTALARNATPATAYFHLPPNRVVELGSQLIL